MGETATLAVVALFLAFYFLPAIIASTRSHEHTVAISMVTLFLGWTMLGWVAALIWAFVND